MHYTIIINEIKLLLRRVLMPKLIRDIPKFAQNQYL